MGKDLLARLNAQQAEAVCLTWGPALIVAGAGSGKTTVLTRRIAYLISHLHQDAESVLAVTFTNKAAAEMKARVEGIVGWQVCRNLTIGTFHSVCARILRREIDEFTSPEGFQWTNNFVIYDETDSLNVMKAQIAKLNLDEKVFVPRDVRHVISSLKNDGYTCSEYSREARTYRETRISEIFTAYQTELAKNNALDFDDLILVFTQLLKTCPHVLERQRKRFRHVLIDEFQDTNKAQYDFVKLLVPETPLISDPASETAAWDQRSLMVVGDVDQSIYSWRKADYRIFLGFQNDFKNAKLIKLEENYRSTSTILEIANSIIENNSERIEKVLRCNRGKGAKANCYEAQDEIDEAYYVVEELKRIKARGRTLNECVILYRTNAQSRAIEEILVRNHIPYTVVGATRFYDRQEIKDVLAYLKLIYNGKDNQSFKRIINSPRRGIGKTTLDKLDAFADRHRISSLDAADSAEQIADVSPKTARALKDFAALIKRWNMLSKAMTVSGLLETVLKETSYIEKLEEDASSAKDELALGRIENIRELAAVAKEFEELADEPDLDSFLTRISLVSDLDSVRMSEDTVKLMTLHSAKGLEFPIVFLMGLEEGLFPHVRSLDSPAALEEERRLMYVGVTRAADALYLTLARKRMLIGRNSQGGSSFTSSFTIPSRFLQEVAPGLLSGYYPAPSREDSIPGSGGAYGAGSAERGGYGNGRYNYGGGGYGDRSSGYGNRGGGGYSRYADAGPAAGANNGSEAKPRAMRIPPNPAAASTPGPAPAAQDFERMNVGDTVQHTKFGTGTIIQVIGERDKELYNVDFGPHHGKRLLDPRFAKLIRIS